MPMKLLCALLLLGSTFGAFAMEKVEVGSASKSKEKLAEKLIQEIKKEHPDLETIKNLLSQGADIEQKDSNGFTALLIAAKHGQNSIAEILLEKGAAVDVFVADFTALHFASHNNHTKVIELLIKYNADVNAIGNDERWTALHMAVMNGSEEAVHVLVNVDNVNLNAKNGHGTSALHLAVKNGFDKIVKPLIDHGADINITMSNDGRTPLHVASCRGSYQSAVLLLKAGADIHKVDGSGYTALLLAAAQDKKELVELLLKHKANIDDVRTTNKMTVLQAAAGKGSKELLQLLLDHGARIDETDEGGGTALHYASSQGNLEGIKFLIAQGANLYAKSLDGSNALHQAAAAGQPEACSLLIKAGIDVNCKDPFGMHALHMAANAGHRDCVELLIDKGADIDAADTQGGHSVLHWGVSEGHVAFCEALVRALVRKLILDDRKTAGERVFCTLCCFIRLRNTDPHLPNEMVYHVFRSSNDLARDVISTLAGNCSRERFFYELFVGARKVLGGERAVQVLCTYVLDKLKKLVTKTNMGEETPSERAKYFHNHPFPYLHRNVQLPNDGSIDYLKIAQLLDPCSISEKTVAKLIERWLQDECADAKFSGSQQVYKKLSQSLIAYSDALIIVKKCVTCSKSGALKRCGTCKEVYYCDVSCQKKDWATHKRFCKKS